MREGVVRRRYRRVMDMDMLLGIGTNRTEGGKQIVDERMSMWIVTGCRIEDPETDGQTQMRRLLGYAWGDGEPVEIK